MWKLTSILLLALAPVGRCAPDDPEPAASVSLQPLWFGLHDSDGNTRQQLKGDADWAANSRLRLGVSFTQSYVYNSLAGDAWPTESYRDFGITTQWRPSDAFKLNVMGGVSRSGDTFNDDGDRVKPALTPVGRIWGTITPFGDSFQLDLGFQRYQLGLSPQIVANRVMRNEFVIRPQIALPSGWRFRTLAELGPVTSVGDTNHRYNAEYTLAHSLGKESEVYTTYGRLHNAKPSEEGYYSPDLVETGEAGWSTEIKRKHFTASFDSAVGAGHSREHDQVFGPWGLSVRVEADLTLKLHGDRELVASYEYDYNQFNPAVQESTPMAWSMNAVKISYRWAPGGGQSVAPKDTIRTRH